MTSTKWVCLSAWPGIQIELFETEVLGVFKTEEITLTRKGVVLGAYDHVRLHEGDQMLFFYDMANRCDVAPFSNFISLT